MSKYTAQHNARILTLVGLSVLLFLSACAGGTSQVEVNRQNDLLTNRQAALAAQPGVAKAAPAVASDQPLSKNAAPQAAEQIQPYAPQQADPQQGAPQPAAPMALDPAAPVQPAVVDSSLPVEPRVGARAPQFTMTTLDGQSVSIDSLVGRPVVIAYWATWCIPCKQELPILQKLAQEYASAGLVVLAVNAIDQDNLDDVKAMSAEKGLSMPVLLDEGAAFAESYQALFFPTTYYVDPSGVIRFIKLGDSTEDDLRLHVEGLIKGEL